MKEEEAQLEFKEEPDIEFKTEDDLEKITSEIEKIEITNLKADAILQKLKNIKFTKLEILSLNDVGITSLEFLNNEYFKTLIVLEIKKTKITSLDGLNKASLAQ